MKYAHEEVRKIIPSSTISASQYTKNFYCNSRRKKRMGHYAQNT